MVSFIGIGGFEVKVHDVLTGIIVAQEPSKMQFACSLMLLRETTEYTRTFAYFSMDNDSATLLQTAKKELIQHFFYIGTLCKTYLFQFQTFFYRQYCFRQNKNLSSFISF